jgi:DNA-binding MarR family transcriptional regulator
MASGLPRVGQLLWEAILLGPPIDGGNEAQRAGRSSPSAANLPAHEERVLRMLQETGEAAPREIAARLGWSRSTTQRALTALLESKRVERHGTTRSTIYRPVSLRNQAA